MPLDTCMVSPRSSSNPPTGASKALSKLSVPPIQQYRTSSLCCCCSSSSSSSSPLLPLLGIDASESSHVLLLLRERVRDRLSPAFALTEDFKDDFAFPTFLPANFFLPPDPSTHFSSSSSSSFFSSSLMPLCISSFSANLVDFFDFAEEMDLDVLFACFPAVTERALSDAFEVETAATSLTSSSSSSSSSASSSLSLPSPLPYAELSSASC
mmetsp:Transcript_9167/g.18816  ORF Transcript_9167/g.18816 Transcript_9167/m.18816 type:complete len:211 (+) Transcript_9167:196-828(+)